ncbi:helix-turn-helix domain-containing protein [Gudongella sp. DL1XJH-153]|uniref:helix-turn-helix domain-containing protein n=1 Tax=Gudongella sp. DL1XJH-153 TaxID=3409804 RepID=UPI003BB54119
MSNYSKHEANKIIGKRLKDFIKWRGYNYKNVAEAIDMSHGYIRHLVGGRYTPSAVTIIKIAVFLDIEIQKLVDGIENWIVPKGLDFYSEQLSASDINLYYNKMEDAKKQYLDDNPEAAKNLGTMGYNEEDEDQEIKVPEAKPGFRLVRMSKHTIHDNSLDLLGIPKSSVLDTVPTDVDKIVDGKIYRIYTSDRIYYRKVVRVDDTLVLIPFSSDYRYTIVKLNQSEVKSIDEVRYVGFSIDLKIKTD